ncbi:ATP-dependent DNA helicase [Clostridium sardiniense]|uniref:ATP-dependent DNA helicase n=1 Tax=Clostridium sardiniense TaxID=29369 RepID=A0ABS7L191_CLOSR|nr:ATP-dependent DNA helicase [Clostridium sardiniense]MBY0756811.1 ATP-dependent DNA helicase [Clostridium sardiniense]MDQ0460498.1 Rad3-related DNA helicase [Clostridium sardiniense]
MNKEVIRESVRGLVEFILKSGSIDSRFSTSKRAVEGIRAHQKLQKSNEEIFDKYEREVYLSNEFELEDFILKIDGRADGIIYEESKVIIEEIKSTYRPLLEIDDSNELHWAQAKVYGYIYSVQNKLDSIEIQLSYYQLESNEVKSFRRNYTIQELNDFLNEIIQGYEKYVVLSVNHRENRNRSIKKLQFPFKSYREGQLKLARAVYGTMRDGKLLFAQAPTGIGKTISTIFPSIKSVGEGIKEKIFYLTAKTVNSQVAENTLNILREEGLKFRSITLTAKQKVCLNDKVSCNPDECKYAVDYYDKSKDVIYSLLKECGNIDRELILKLAKENEICPFELSLDMINWCDGVICDYNYIFDRRVGLKRVVEDMGDEIALLIDEGHNLVDRGRSMYSATLNKSKFLEMRRELKGKVPNLYNVVNKINAYFVTVRRECESREQNSYYEKEAPKELYKYLRIFIGESEELLVKLKGEPYYDELLDLYFDINKFVGVSEYYGDEYVTYVENDYNEVSITLFCINPADKIKAITDKIKGTVIFSATLSPIDYYIELLGGNEDSYRLRLKSPFDSSKFDANVHPANTRFRFREKTIKDIEDKIREFLQERKGNSLIFFPSYDYLDMFIKNINKEFDGYKMLVQEREMNEEDKERFISEFRENNNMVGFAVLGGIFSEGIDLPGDMLIGTVVVGVGYPQISIEREIIKDYFEGKGYDYAYIYPGINKVLQAVGRVIRTEEDEGKALLVDDRYLTSKYKSLLPREWDIN